MWATEVLLFKFDFRRVDAIAKLAAEHESNKYFDLGQGLELVTGGFFFFNGRQNDLKIVSFFA